MYETCSFFALTSCSDSLKLACTPLHPSTRRLHLLGIVALTSIPLQAAESQTGLRDLQVVLHFLMLPHHPHQWTWFAADPTLSQHGSHGHKAQTAESDDLCYDS